MYGLGKKRSDISTATKKNVSEPPKISNAPEQEIKDEVPEKLPAEAVIVRIEQQSDIFQAFRNDKSLIDIILRQLRAIDLLKLRVTCHDFYDLVLSYLQRLLKNAPFMPGDDGKTDMDFWYRAMRFFFNDLVQLHPVTRLTYKPVALALKFNRDQGFPLGSHQMQSRCIITLDDLPPGTIQICDHEFPQRHTASIDRKLDIPSQAFSDVISLARFVHEYRLRIVHSQPDELVWASFAHSAYIASNADSFLAALLFETFLRGISDIIQLRRGRLTFRRTEYLGNGGHLLRHRLWYQIVAAWGWEDVRPCVQRLLAKEKLKQEADIKKKPAKKSWAIRLPPGSRQDASDTKKSGIHNQSLTDKGKTGSGSKASASKMTEIPIPPGRFPKLFLTISDHFQWDA